MLTEPLAGPRRISSPSFRFTAEAEAIKGEASSAEALPPPLHPLSKVKYAESSFPISICSAARLLDLNLAFSFVAQAGVRVADLQSGTPHSRDAVTMNELGCRWALSLLGRR
jgi:hypothetical protein